MRSIARVALTFVLAWTLLHGSCGAQEKKMFSGPQKGESISPFRVLKIINPEESKELLIKPQKHKTNFVIFVHKVTEPLILLLMTLDWYASQQKELDRHYVLLTAEKADGEQRAKRWASRSLFRKTTKWSVSLDGAEGPGRYGLNRKAVVTLLVAKDNLVVSNFALTQPNNTDAPKILAALAEALGKRAPSYEKVHTELEAHRKRQRNRQRAQNPIFKLAPNEELGRLMLAMLFREDNSEEAVQNAAKQLTKWAGDDKKKNAALVKYCKALLKGNFRFNRYAHEALKEIAGE